MKRAPEKVIDQKHRFVLNRSVDSKTRLSADHIPALTFHTRLNNA